MWFNYLASNVLCEYMKLIAAKKLENFSYGNLAICESMWLAAPKADVFLIFCLLIGESCSRRTLNFKATLLFHDLLLMAAGFS